MVDLQRLTELQARVAGALCNLPGATALYLYGSAADPARRDAYSDLDLQVLTVDLQVSKEHLLTVLEQVGALTLAYLLTDTASEIAYSIAYAGESPYHKVDLGITCLNDPAHPPAFFEQIGHKELLWSQKFPPLERALQNRQSIPLIPFSQEKGAPIAAGALLPSLEGRAGERFLPVTHSVGRPYCPAQNSPAYFLVGEILSAFRYVKARRRGRHLVCWRFLAAKFNALLALTWWQHKGGVRIPERLSTWDFVELDELLPESARLDMLKAIDCRQPAQMDRALLDITRRMVTLVCPSLGELDQPAVGLAEQGLAFIAQELK